MSCGGPLSAVMMVAGAGMLPGAGSIAGIGSALGVSPALTSSLTSFTSLPITSTFSDIVSGATGILDGGVLDSLRTLAADTFPALTNAIPGSFVSDLASIAPGGVFDGGFTGLIADTAAGFMGDGDLSKFSQIFNIGTGFASQANQFVNSVLNVDSLVSTFGPITGGMDNLITGSVNQVSEAFGAFGGDLSNLGSLIDMNNLTNLGDPSALVRQVVNIGGVTPAVENVLRVAGLDSIDITDIATGGYAGISDTANARLYQGLTQVTGSDLAQVKAILGVSTPNITTMADLLNPAKILPTSFPTLTMPTPDGLRGIYADASGAVNTALERFLVDPNAPPYTGDDPIVRARLGLQPLGSDSTTLI